MNATEAQVVKDQLLVSDASYRELVEQHHQLDYRLHQLTSQPYLSNSEQLEEATLKKRKLALKDRMEHMARLYAESRQSRGH